MGVRGSRFKTMSLESTENENLNRSSAICLHHIAGRWLLAGQNGSDCETVDGEPNALQNYCCCCFSILHTGLLE